MNAYNSLNAYNYFKSMVKREPSTAGLNTQPGSTRTEQEVASGRCTCTSG